MTKTDLKKYLQSKRVLVVGAAIISTVIILTVIAIVLSFISISNPFLKTQEIEIDKVYNAEDSGIVLEFDENHTVIVGDRVYSGETIEIPLNEIPEGEITLQYQRKHDAGPYTFVGNQIQKDIYVDTTKPEQLDTSKLQSTVIQENNLVIPQSTIGDDEVLKVNGEVIEPTEDGYTLNLVDGINNFTVEVIDRAGNSSDPVEYSPNALIGDNYVEAGCPDHFSFLYDTRDTQIGMIFDQEKAFFPRSLFTGEIFYDEIPNFDRTAAKTREGQCEVLGEGADPNFNFMSPYDIFHLHTPGTYIYCLACGTNTTPNMYFAIPRDYESPLEETISEKVDYTNARGVEGKIYTTETVNDIYASPLHTVTKIFEYQTKEGQTIQVSYFYQFAEGYEKGLEDVDEREIYFNKIIDTITTDV
jgi:hypothetical protein